MGLFARSQITSSFFHFWIWDANAGLDESDEWQSVY
jgi:hypothetical protein